MTCKIITFAIILDTPIPDKDKVKDILLDGGFSLKHYEIRLMEAYGKNGKRIENKLVSNHPSIEKHGKNGAYQLKGKYCDVDFSRNSPLIFYKFGEKMEEIKYDFTKNHEEIESVISILNQFAKYDVSPCQLLVSLSIRGTQNSDKVLLNLKRTDTEEFIIKDTFNAISDMKIPPSKLQEEQLRYSPHPSPAEHLEVHFEGKVDSKSACTEAVVRAKEGDYSLLLRFKTTGTDNALSDLVRSEEFGLNIIEKLESAGTDSPSS